MKNLRIPILLLLISLFVGCTATKKKSEEDVRGFKKSMHDLNARFNGYHNAKVILTESFANLSRQHQDNYNQILALYRESAVDDASSVAGQLDEAIKKSSIVISLHRVSKWTDNAYMVIGQSQYLKQEYDKAAETFMYVISEYDPQNIYEKEYKRLKRKKNKKKKVKRLKGEALKEELAKKKYHRTERKNAMIWLARAKVDQEYYEDAQILIDKLLKDESLKKRQRVQLKAIDAYNSLKQGEYAKSVAPLKEAIAITKRKKQKNRYVYILAQIYQLQGMEKEAAIAYKQVLKMRPEYPMEFRTRLNMIVNEWASGKSNSKSASSSLTRMTKDIKNEEYQDQIYFAMANIAIKENKTDEAIAFLKKSLKFNTNNKPQKAESYLKLAEIYFDQEEYVSSKNYYDSTKQVMATKDPRYEIVHEYTVNLEDIAANIEIVEKNDSLLRIKDMNPDERIALAKKIKKEQSLSEKGKESDPKERFASRTSSFPGTPKESSFFAFNENLVKKGKRDFEKVWGNRQLEDNWRRSIKATSADQTIASSEEESASEIIVTSEEVEKIFADVPESPEELEKLHGENIEALYALGELYRERLKNNKKSIEAFEELLERYPNNKYNVEAMYSLYLLHEEEGNSALASNYKDKVLKGYPDSRHAKMILNPNAASEIEVADKEVYEYYNQVFALYKNGGFEEAMNKIKAVDKVLGDANNIRPKFALLAALCTGSLSGKEDYVNALNVVVKDYPDSDEARKANEYLAILGGGTGSASVNPGDKKPYEGRDKSSLFKDAFNDQHYVIVVLSSSEIKIEKIKEAISDYNKKYNNLESFKISTLTLEIDPYIMIIRRFHNGEHAYKYANLANSKKGEFLKNLDPSAKIYPLSQTNYKTVLRMREIMPYLQYCERTYSYSGE